jgi:hypothetical protein
VHPADRLWGLQRAAGNAAVAALVSGPADCAECRRPLSPAPLALHRGIGDAVADALDMREGEADLDAQEDYEDAVEEKTDWIAEGVRGPKDVRAPTGIGGFGAQYDPALNQLTITLSGGVTFTDGLSIDGSGTVTANQTSGAAASAVTQIMAAPPEQRAALVAPFQWATDPASKAGFLTGFTSTVQSAWSEKFAFRCAKKYWEDLGAIVQVVVSVHEGAKAANEHLSLTTYKVPSTFTGPVGVVNSGGGGATNNTMVLNSNDVVARRDNLLVPSPIRFDPGLTTLTAAGKAGVKYTANVFQAANPVCATCGRAVPGLTGPALTIACEGDLNVSMASEEEEAEERERIAEERYLAIVFALIDEGFTNAADRVTMVIAPTTGGTCRITAESGAAQVVAEHEAGHMFGLGDEYATSPGGITGTGPAAGGATSHDQLAKDMGLEGAVAENNDNIMAIGGVVRPQHYATFFWALKDVTGMEEWVLGEPQLVGPPGGGKPSGGRGDFPTPTGDSAVV